jgi:hypothetical protein
MKLLVSALALLLSSPFLAAQTKPPGLMSGLGQHHHLISTSNPEAQRFFDQGLTLVFGFNHEEAVRAFQRAAELDPQSAMPHWGVALALGPCINLDVDPPHEKAAYEAVQEARSLAQNATESERAYIDALVKRYSVEHKTHSKQLDVDYAHAMRELSQRYPEDLDAATLYAESLMDLRPWKQWSLDGLPAEDTEEIVAVLESVLRRDPYHIGANHYYIHVTEASPHPERALASAWRLETLAPGAGHLVHMPAHTYMRTGDYLAAARSNALAAETDRVYLRESGTTGSVYDMMYYAHNLHFLLAAESMAGEFAVAKQAADELATHVRPMIHDMPMAETYLPTPIFVLVRFHRWDENLENACAGSAARDDHSVLAFRTWIGSSSERPDRDRRNGAQNSASGPHRHARRHGVQLLFQQGARLSRSGRKHPGCPHRCCSWRSTSRNRILAGSCPHSGWSQLRGAARMVLSRA